MPIVRIDMIEGRTLEQKRKIVQEITDTLVRVAKAEDVRIVIVDHPKENLASGGELLSDKKLYYFRTPDRPHHRSGPEGPSSDLRSLPPR